MAQLRLTLRSELHTLLTRWQQMLPTHWQAAAGAAPAITPMAAATATDEDVAAIDEDVTADERWRPACLPPLLLPQPELFAAMATVRDGLAVRPGTRATHPHGPSSRPLPRAHLHTHLD